MFQAAYAALKRVISPRGLFVRRERWGFSRKGWLLFAFGMTALVLGLVRGARPFLTVNNGGNGELMVVEGWISTHRVEEAADAFRQGHYQRAVVVKNVSQQGDKWETGAYTADWVASDLVANGIPKDKIQLIFCPVVRKDRTYTCAMAVRQWIEQSGLSVKSIDVATLAVHTRRSRLLYEKAFGNNVDIRAIALPDLDYDFDHWWRSSEGIHEVPFELMAYLYVRFFFSPDTAAVHFHTDQSRTDDKTTSSQPTQDRHLNSSAPVMEPMRRQYFNPAITMHGRFG